VWHLLHDTKEGIMKSRANWGLLASLATALPGGAVHAQQPTIKMTAVNQAAVTQPQYTEVDVPLIKQGLPQKSNGRIDVTLATWTERGVNGPEVIRLVRSGTVDMGTAPLNTVSGDVPLLDIADLAGLNPSVEQARKVATAIVPEANKALERFNVRIVATFAYTAQVFFCREPVTSLAALQGKRVRTGGGSINDFVNAIGAQAVGIGLPEVYTALERGTVDCAITGTGTGNNVKWYEVTKGLYNLTVGWSTAAYFVNLAWWNKLDTAARDLIAATMQEVEERQWKLAGDLTEAGIACNVGDAAKCKGGTLVQKNPMVAQQPLASDQERMRTVLVQSILPTWIRRCGAQCAEAYNNLVAPISGVRVER
jgi:TRAP-type C4-dicarboxylate transport system substrate-binding protein